MNEIALSNEFSRLLRKELTEEQLITVIERNKLASYLNACATHDFMDANMVMDEAFTNVFNRDFDFESELDSALFDAAWNMSKEKEFAI